MKARVLIVEDENEISELIALYFDREGAEVSQAASGDHALALFAPSVFDIVILDINLPGTDGFEVLSQIRRQSDIPVIILSAREADEDQIYGLGIGADEYVTKPFSPRVLVARARALLRRRSEAPHTGIRFGPFRYDPQSYVLVKNGDRVSLSAKEYDVLTALIQAEGAPLRAEDLYERVWGNQYGDVSTVGVYVQRLRRKLEADPGRPQFIETIHGKGYRFCAERISRESSSVRDARIGGEGET